ncbi:MAG: type II secretion system protein M [Burkholderiaceae bacterium]|jgi:general secretion pathway protein M|nr:type II secretion system protein M [Burkholderiaceae bacterium]
MTVPAAATAWRAFWQRLAPRERMAVALAAAVIGVGLIWGLLLVPALGALRQAGQERLALAAQAQQMQRLVQQAQALKALPKLSAADALRALQTATDQRLGQSAKLTAQGERASLTLTRVSAAQLAAWLAEARANARASVQEMRLTRDASAASGAAPLWSGTLALTLPPS